MTKKKNPLYDFPETIYKRLTRVICVRDCYSLCNERCYQAFHVYWAEPEDKYDRDRVVWFRDADENDAWDFWWVDYDDFKKHFKILGWNPIPQDDEDIYRAMTEISEKPWE